MDIAASTLPEFWPYKPLKKEKESKSKIKRSQNKKKHSLTPHEGGLGVPHAASVINSITSLSYGCASSSEFHHVPFEMLYAIPGH